MAYAALGRVEEAIGYHQQALEIHREIGDRRGEGIDAWNLGAAYEKLGRYTEACESMKLMVDYEREIGHPDAKEHARWREEVCRKAQG